MDGDDEAVVYDELDRMWGDVLFQGFAESAARMGVTRGRVLDVGTGTGRLAIRLARLNPELSIEAVDLSDSMLDLARENAARAGVTNVSFAVADAKRLPYPDGTFDLTISHQLLHHFANPAVPLAEMNRVTRRQGGILVRDVRRLGGSLMTLVLPLWTFGYSPRLRTLTAQSFRAGLSRAEFKALGREAGVDDLNYSAHWLTHQSLFRAARPYARLEGPGRKDTTWLTTALKSLYVLALETSHP